MTLSWCNHCGARGEKDAETQYLEKLLPPGYDHLVCKHETKRDADDPGNFRLSLKLRVTTEDEVQKWLEDFQKSSYLTWRKSRTYPDSGRYNKYRVDLRCQYKTYTTTAKRTKNTNCCATMFLVLKRQMKERKSRSGDPHMAEGYFLHVNLRNEHNHRLCPEAMQRRDVSKDTIEKLQTLFKNGHSPSSALRTIKQDLQENEGDNYIYALADRSICPNLQFCYSRLYHKLFKKTYRASSGKSIAVDWFKTLEPSGQTVPVFEGENTDPGNEAGHSVPESLENQLAEVFAVLKRKLQEDSSFTHPLKTFASNFFQMKSDGAIQSALMCFGKPAGASRATGLRSKGFPKALKTGVRPVAGSQRKAAQRERRGLRRGRGTESSIEHPYFKTSAATVSPNNLVFCEQNVSLGEMQ